MSNKKHSYIITFNTLSEEPKTYKYTYSNTKDITLKISENAISISLEMGEIYTKDEIFSNKKRTFYDAIKKGMLLHILLHSCSIELKKLSIQIDGKEENKKQNFKTFPQIYSLINNKLERELPKKFDNQDIINNILKIVESENDPRMSSLLALIYSKDKIYELERFIYLWMSFNGMYNYLDKLTSKDYSESDQILNILKLLGIGNQRIIKSESSAIAHEVEKIIKDYPSDITETNLKSNKKNSIRAQIENVLINKDGTKINITAYGYMLTQFSYYYRCKIFHAKKPLPLIRYENDLDIVSLKIINNILEKFIDNNLPQWFDKDYIINKLTPFAEKLDKKEQKKNTNNSNIKQKKRNKKASKI